jgi:hypothetical protein
MVDKFPLLVQNSHGGGKPLGDNACMVEENPLYTDAYDG